MRRPRLALLALMAASPFSTSLAQNASPNDLRPSVVAMAVRVSLRGVPLAADQQTQIKTVVTQRRPQLAAVRDSMAPWVARLRAARQQNDTAAARAALREIRRGRFGVAQIARQTLAQVRPMLTAAQQTRFDTNVRRVKPMLVRFVRRGRRPR